MSRSSEKLFDSAIGLLGKVIGATFTALGPSSSELESAEEEEEICLRGRITVGTLRLSFCCSLPESESELPLEDVFLTKIRFEDGVGLNPAATTGLICPSDSSSLLEEDEEDWEDSLLGRILGAVSNSPWTPRSSSDDEEEEEVFLPKDFPVARTGGLIGLII